MYWFGFWGRKLYTFSEILDMVREDEVLEVGEDSFVIRKVEGGEVVREFTRYSVNGLNYVYIEKSSSR